MTSYVLDTDMLTLFEDGHAAVLQHVRAHAPEELAITVLSVEEQLSGWYTELRQAKSPGRLAWAYGRLTNTVHFLARLQILTFDESGIERYDELRKRRLKIRKMDLRIAAVVRQHNATLVTRNLRDFRRIPGLHIEDWSK